MKISIVIPTFNEAENIGSLIGYLLKHGGNSLAEVIITDGGSTDDTLAIAKNSGAIAVVSPCKGRAAQMNYGASLASGDLFYFIHADSFPPAGFRTDIEQKVNNGFSFGRYRTKFNSNRWILKLNAFFTRFDWFVCYGGDQTLFVKKTLFEEINGFDESLRIMEDYDIVIRAKQKASYAIIQKDTLVSARKYDTNSWWRVQRANYLIVRMFKKGAAQEQMVARYKKFLDYR
jgi:rSAM/selenodomain-associated transferase 2